MKICINLIFFFIGIAITTVESYGQHANSGASLWSVQEREHLLKELERARADLMKEIRDLNGQQWVFKENNNRWSIAEIVEHLFAQNESYRVEMRTALAQPELTQFAGTTKKNDAVFINYVTDTLKADAGFLSPIGRFCEKEKAIYAYNRTHDALVQMIKTSNKDFRKHFTFRNYVFDGHLTDAEKYNIRDMHQLMLTCIAHIDRHLAQLRNVKKHPAYPK